MPKNRKDQDSGKPLRTVAEVARALGIEEEEIEALGLVGEDARNCGEEEVAERKAVVKLAMSLEDENGLKNLIFDGKIAALVRSMPGEFVAINGLNRAEGRGPSVAAALFRLLESSVAVHEKVDLRGDREAEGGAEELFCRRCENIEAIPASWESVLAIAYTGFTAIAEYLEIHSSHAAEHVNRLKARVLELIRNSPAVGAEWDEVRKKILAQTEKAPAEEGRRKPGPMGVVIVPSEGIGNH